MARREFNPDAPYEALAFAAAKHPALQPSGRTLLVQPKVHPALSMFNPAATDCIVYERRDWERFRERGYTVLDGEPSRDAYQLAVAFPGESRDETLGMLAVSALAVKAGGVVAATMSNDLGASRFENKLMELLGSVESQSKSRCRVFWAVKGAPDAALATAWLELTKTKEIPGSGLLSLPGLFSAQKIDRGSQLLIKHLPSVLSGRVADLGCGYGYLAAEALKKCPGITSLDLYDSDKRAVDLAEKNVSPLAAGRTVTVHWQDVRALEPDGAGRFDAVIMNPPFHEYGTLKVELGARFFKAARTALHPGGTLYAVVNRHLPYDKALEGNFGAARDIASEEGYRIIAAS